MMCLHHGTVAVLPVVQLRADLPCEWDAKESEARRRREIDNRHGGVCGGVNFPTKLPATQLS